MTDIDLIPSSYRRRRGVRSLSIRFGAVYGVVAVALLAAKLGLSFGIDARASEIERLRADKDSVLQKLTHIDALETQREALNRQLSLLERLRGGPATRAVFAAMDSALAGDVWFTAWTFMREGEFVEVAPTTVETGYFLIVSDSGADDGGRAWRMKTHMEISATALDHSALARFVTRLASQGIIGDVKVLNTRSRREASASVVDFELAVVLRDSGGVS